MCVWLGWEWRARLHTVLSSTGLQESHFDCCMRVSWGVGELSTRKISVAFSEPLKPLPVGPCLCVSPSSLIHHTSSRMEVILIILHSL